MGDMKDVLLEKAILQELSEKVGFEEAKMYWAIIRFNPLKSFNLTSFLSCVAVLISF